MNEVTCLNYHKPKRNQLPKEKLMQLWHNFFTHNDLITLQQCNPLRFINGILRLIVILNKKFHNPCFLGLSTTTDREF